MGFVNSRSAACLSWLLMSLALLNVQAQYSRYGSRRFSSRRISHHSPKMQSASASLLHPISVPLLPGAILKLPPPPSKFAYATIAPIPTKDDPNDQINGFIQLVRAKLPLYPPAPYYEPTAAPATTAVPTTVAATTVPPTTTAKPITVKAYVRPTRPYVRPPPPRAKPVTTPKAIIFKTAKPFKKTTFKNFQKFTKATPAPTSSVAAPSAAPSAAPELAPIEDVRVVGGEMMKVGVTKAIEPATVASEVTAPAVISTAAPAAVPSATTAPAPVATDPPATEAVKVNTPIPLSFSSFQPRPFYRPAIYTRPPFRPHLQYTLLPKTPATPEVEKAIIDVRVTLPTTTETVPEIVTVKEEVTEPAPFNDFGMINVDEMFIKLPVVPEENSIPVSDEEPESSESTELPEVIFEELSIVEAPEEPITFEDDAKDIENIEIAPEEPKLLEDIPIEPEIIEVIPFESEILGDVPFESEILEEPQIIESIPIDPIVEDEPEILETITDAPEIPEIIPEVTKILDIIPDEPDSFEIAPEEPGILEFIQDEPEISDFFDPEILDIIPEELQIIELIPEELMVDDPVSDEATSLEIIPEIPITFEDVPKELEVFEPEFVEPQIVETEKLLPIDNTFFEPIFSDPANDIRLSIEETETAEGPDSGLEIISISEDINKAVPVADELPKIIEDVVEPELVSQERPDSLKAPELIPVAEEDVEENAPITEVTEAQLLLKKVEPQPFKRSQEYKPIWNIHSFGHGNKKQKPKVSQSFPGWPEVSSTTRKSLDYPTWLQSTTLSPFARNAPDWPQDITTHRGYVFSKWSPQLKNEKESTTGTLNSGKPFNSEIKTVESSTKKSIKQNASLNNVKGLRISRGRGGGRGVGRLRKRTSTVKPTTRRGTLPDTLTNIKITTVKPPTRSTLFPTWDEIQTRKASRERTSAETKDSNSGFDAFGTDFGSDFGGWGGKI